LKTYGWSTSLDIETIAAPNGVTEDYSAVDGKAACVIVQYPNFFGGIEDLAAARDAARNVGAMFIVVADPVACALLKSPGEYDADIVVGEGQPWHRDGYGGPLCGLFTCKESLVRRIPGRIVGRTKEAHGDKIGYVMTLRTREQDIGARRRPRISVQTKP